MNSLNQTQIIGRAAELASLKQHLADAIAGKGSTVLVSGEPGIGKTALVETFKEYAATQNVKIFSGAASADSAQPFLVFSKALAGEMDAPLFEEQEYTRFVKIFAINRAGMLVAEASSEEGDMDADIFAGMLSAVQNFVGESLGQGESAGLGRLEYGDMKILIEHSEHLFLTGIFAGSEHADMKNMLNQTLGEIEKKYGQLLESWTGKMSEITPIQEEIAKLAGARFLVRTDLEGVKLENERVRIADRILEEIHNISDEKGLILFLEDLHWTDESSLFVFNYLARNLRLGKTLILGTARPKDNQKLNTVLKKMREEDIIAELELKVLEMNDVAGMINTAYPENDFSREFIESLAERCSGNPFFVVEFMKHLNAEGAIVQRNGKYLLVNMNFTVPGSVEELIQNRLNILSHEALAFAEYASCVGREFRIDTVSSNAIVKNPITALDELQKTGITFWRDGKAEFCHAMYQDVIYSTLSDRWKSAHHKSIGEYLEVAHRMNPDEAMYELARHFSKTGEHAKAFDYCRSAGEKAESAYAPEQALAFYSDALTNLRKSRKAPDSEAQEFGILEKLGDVSAFASSFGDALDYYDMAGKILTSTVASARLLRKMAEARFKTGEYEASLELLGRARKCIGGERHIERGKISFSESNVHTMKGDYDRSLTLLKEALAVFEAEPHNEKEVGNSLRAFASVYWRMGEYDAALKYAQMSLDAMEKLNDQQGTALALNALGLINYDKGEYDTALKYYERALSIMERTGEKYAMTMVLNNLGLLHANACRFDTALEYHRRSLEFRERVGDKEGIAASLINMAHLYSSMGDTTKTMEMYERSAAISKAIGARKNLASALSSMGYVHYLHGELNEAERLYRESIGICEETGEKYILAYALDNLSDIYQENGDLEKVLELQTQVLKIREEIGDRNDLPWTHCGISQAHLHLGNIDLALQHAETARSLATEIGLGMELGTSHLALGMIYRETNDYDTAVRMFEVAERHLRESGYKRLLALATYEYALLHRAMGNVSQARECLTKALADFEGTGMYLWVEKCKKTMAEF